MSVEYTSKGLWERESVRTNTLHSYNMMIEHYWNRLKNICSCKNVFFACVGIVISISLSVGYIQFRNVKKTTIRKTPKYPMEVFKTVGKEGFQMFLECDKDWDDRISIQEFNKMFLHLTHLPKNWDYYLNILDIDEIVTLQAKFRQRNLYHSIKSEKQKQEDLVLYGLNDIFHGIEVWQKPNKEWYNFAVRHFRTFFPPHSITEVGKIYKILPCELSDAAAPDPKTGKKQKIISGKLYYPPLVKVQYGPIQKMLSMFHLNAFIIKRNSPKGGYAVIRAKNEDYIEIVFRIAAEFQLSEPPNTQLWLTPIPFKGSLVISTDMDHILSFRMFIPTDREAHFGDDLEWVEHQFYQISEEHILEMSLEATSPSVPVSPINRYKKLPHQASNTRQIKWIEKIPYDEAYEIINKKLKVRKKKRKVQNMNFDPYNPQVFEGNGPMKFEHFP